MTDRAADQGASRWDGRPVLSFLIRAGVFTIPILASIVVSIWLSRVLPEPQDLLGLLRWWGLILGASTGVLFVVNFLARKFLPLAALMKMSMVFPDKAPGRFKTALRSGSSVKHLKAQLAEAERLGRHDDPDVAAEFILQLSNNLNSHDRRTRGHAERVRAYAEMLAEEMGLGEKQRAKLRWASLLHDIGKLKVSTDILNKPGRLDDGEWLEIKKHPRYGEEICAPLLDWLGDFADTIVDHHERYDGNGYPQGKKGDEISLGGRIVAVADAFDVMTTVRSYKAAMPGSAAREELARNAGSQFDPVVVRAFLNISMGRLRWVAGPLSWLAQLPFLRFVGAVQQVGTAVGVAGAAATGVAAVVGGGLVDLPGDEPLPLLPVEELQAAAPPTPTTVPVAVLVDDSVQAREDESVTFDLAANDGLRGAISIVDDPDFGRVVLNADGTVTYIPNPDFSGDDTFSYSVDGAAPARVVVRVGPVNDLPLAVDDPAEVDEDGEVQIAVLGNDVDTEGLDPSTLRIVAGPFNGRAVVDRTAGTITYTPNENFAGTDGFTYVVADTDGAETEAQVVIEVRQVNDPPTAGDDTATTEEDTAVIVDVLANDADPDGVLQRIEIVRAPARGTASVTSGAIRYRPAADTWGVDSFTYRACDEAGECATAGVTVQVTPVNDGPVLGLVPTVDTDEDVAVHIDLLASAGDADGDPLTLSVPPATAKGGQLDPAGGAVIYVPPADFAGSDSFAFTVSDGAGGTVEGVVAIAVAEVNDPPVVPGPGRLTTDEDTAISFDPLAGATDVDGDSLAVAVFDAVSATGGTVVEGSLIYTPPADFHGTDTFSYTVGDGRGGEATVTVHVDVKPVNDAPTLPDGSYTTDEDAALVIPAPGVLAGAADIDGDALTASIGAFPTHGTLSLAPDGAFTYSPAPEYSGPDAFAVTAADGAGGWVTATFTIEVLPVNDAPVAAASAHSVAEDGALVVPAPGVLAGAADADGDPLSASMASAPAHGTVSLAADGGFTYVPDPDFTGTDSFTVAATDPAGAAGTATVVIEVGPVPDDPVAAGDAYPVGEDGVLVIAAPGVLGNDADVDGDPLTAALLTPPANGVVSLAADGGFTYAPSADWNGVDTFTYEADDGTGRTDAATVEISVAPVNDAPVGNDDAAATSEDTLVVVDALANDTDVEDGTPAGAVTVVAGPSNGTLVDNGDGTFDYTPDLDWSGVDGFTYQVADAAGADSNLATVTVTVAAVNDSPVANDDATTTPEDNPVVVAPAANDTDVEDGTPAGAVTVLGGAANGTLVDNLDGTFTYTPDPDWNGVDSFTYRVADSAGAPSGPATVTITVGVVNDPPVANDDAVATGEDSLVTVDVVANDTDVEDGTPAGAVSLVGAASNGTVVNNGDGTFDYTPDPDWNGVDSFTYQVADAAGADSNVATVTVTVTPVNDPPVANDDAGAGFTTAEDAAFTTADVVANDTDVEDGTPAGAVSLVGAASNGTVVNNGDGTFDYTPDPDWNGVDSFTYQVADAAGADSNVATVTVTVTPVNDPPVVDPIADQTEDEGVAVTFTATASDPQDSPPDTVTFSLSGAPAGATINPATGAFSWTPTEAQGPGVYTFDVVGTDDGTPNLSDTEAVQITVNEVNQPPVLDPVGAQSGDELTAITFTATASDPDLPANTLTFSLAGAVPPGAAINSSSGAFSWTPTEAQGPGSYTFDVVATDDGTPAQADIETITVTVDEANQPPALDPIADPTGAEGAPITFTANATDADLPAQGITYLLVGEPAGASINSTTGAFSWTPTEAQGPGTYTFDVIAEDDGTPALSDVDGVTVTVTEVNQPPTATNPGDQSSGVGQPVSVFVPATDPDLPANTLTWDDAGSLPAGLSINAATGEITGSAAGAGVTTVTITVDDGSLTDAVSFDWTVTATSADVKISEFRTTGPAGAADEFIELYNTGTAAQSLVGWTIQLYNGAGNPVGAPIALASGAVTDIQPKSWYLLAGSAYSGAAASDQPAFGDNIAIGGGAELLDDLGNTVDLVGSANPATPLPRMSGTNDQSYERRDGPGYGNCVDSGTDTDDFVHNMVVSNPTNSTAPSEPCGTPPPPSVPVGPPHMVISEFRTSGPGGPNDEFVELFNPAQATIDLNGYEIRDSGGVAIHVFSAPTPVVAGGHYTVGNPPYSGPSDANYSEPSTLANGGAVQLWDGSTVVDVVGTSGGVPFETQPLPPMTTSGSNEESYERVGGNCQDTDDNGADFYHNLASINPQTSADPPTPCPSPAGDVIINEVLYADRVGIMDEMIELYNAGSSAYDLSFWVIADSNFPIADVDAAPFNYVIPGTDLHGSASLLGPGEYAVIWLQAYDSKQGAPFAALEFTAGLGLSPALAEAGDDVYVWDDAGNPVDYMRWGAGAQLNAPTLPWDGTFDAANAAAIAAGSGQSLSLTPNAADADLSACWEPTDSGLAGGRAACAGAPATQQHDLDLRLASPGVDNNDPYPKSPFYGQVVVNEVSNANSGDQFVELTNATVAPIDITGWTVVDGNVRIDELDGGGSSFGFTFPASSVLPPGGHAVVWVQDPGPETQASPFTDLEFWAGDNSSALKASADELWIYDTDLAVVDFMAWGGGGDPAKGEAPDPLADFWDDSAQGPLGSPPADSSLSLTADGVDSDDSACWEFTTSGTSGCGPPTVDNDDWPLRVASPGDDNNLATADLEVTVAASTPRPSNGGTVSYTVTVTNHSLSNAVGGVEVTDLLPAGLTYVSDDSGGDYVPATGVWTAGTVAANSSAALVIDATVTAAEGTGVDNTATITGAARPDPNAANNADTASITINQSPTPVNDSTTVLQAIPATIAVLGNDSDPDGDALTITAWDAVSAQGGTVDCSSGANCTYTGAPGFGSPPDDTFTYTVDDGYGGTAVATVTVTVTAASGDPLFLETDGTTDKGVVLPLTPPPFAASHPGTPAVPDWNDNADGQPGRKLQRSGAAPPWDEDNEDKHQTWAFAVTDPGGLAVGGPTRLRIWAAMKDFDTLDIGEFHVRISQCPPGAASASNAVDGCTSLGTGAYDSDPAPFAPSGGFEQFEVNVALPSITIAQGDELRVKVIAASGSGDDLMVAYDTDATVSVLYFP